jgi:hypothetical protein
MTFSIQWQGAAPRRKNLAVGATVALKKCMPVAADLHPARAQDPLLALSTDPSPAAILENRIKHMIPHRRKRPHWRDRQRYASFVKSINQMLQLNLDDGAKIVSRLGCDAHNFVDAVY